METSPLEAWLELFMMPAKLQVAMIGAMMGGTGQLSLTATSSRRRSTANLTLVSSNNWVRKHRSMANLSVVRK